MEQLESRWLLTTTAVSFETADKQLMAMSEAAYLFSPLEAASLPTDTFSSAIKLPEAPNVQVKGTHGPGDAPDMIMIPVNANTGVIKLNLKSGTPGQPLLEALKVLDPMNRELAYSTPGPNTTLITVRLPVWGKDTTAVYVQIVFHDPAETGAGGGVGAGVGGGVGTGVGSSGEPGSETFPYILEVIRVPSPPMPTSSVDLDAYLTFWELFQAANSPRIGSEGFVPPLVIDLPKDAPTPTDTEPLPPSESPDPPDPPDPPRGQSPADLPWSGFGPVSVGPLPMRSAAPLGGVLGMSDPVPEVDPHEPARADLATFDPASDPGVIEVVERPIVQAAEPDAEPVDVPFVVVRGPGGLPLLATALVGGPTVSRAATPLAAKACGGTPATSPTVLPVQLTSKTGEVRSLIPTDGRPDESVKARRTRRASVLPGVTLALVLGIGLMLPDLVAAFQFTPPARPRLRLALLRRALRNGLA